MSEKSLKNAMATCCRRHSKAGKRPTWVPDRAPANLPRNIQTHRCFSFARRVPDAGAGSPARRHNRFIKTPNNLPLHRDWAG